MKVRNFFIKLISSLFVLIFGLLCLTTTVFLLAKNMTSQENITYYVKSANVFDYPINDIISDNQKETLRQTIQNELLKIDIPALVVDEVLDSDELYQIISNYIYNYSKYILYDKDKPVFPSDNVLNIVKEKYTKYENKTLSEKQSSEVLKYTEQLGKKIDQGIFDKNEIDEMLSINIIKKVANVFDSKYMTMALLLTIIILFIIISICLSSVKKAINWCGKITILNGALLIIASFIEVRILIMYFNSQGLLDSLAISIVENGFKNMLVYGIVLIVIGIVFAVISGVLLKKEKNNLQKPKKYEQKIIPKEDSIIDNYEETKEEKIDSKEESEIEKQEVEDKKTIDDSDKQEEVEPIIEKEESNQEQSQKDETKENQSDQQEKQKQEEVTIIPVSEEEKEEEEPEVEENTEIEIEMEESVENEPDEEEQNNDEEYTEIKDEKEIDTPIVKTDIKITHLEPIKVDLVLPEKGKDVEFKPEEKEDEEEIEVL